MPEPPNNAECHWQNRHLDISSLKLEMAIVIITIALIVTVSSSRACRFHDPWCTWSGWCDFVKRIRRHEKVDLALLLRIVGIVLEVGKRQTCHLTQEIQAESGRKRKVVFFFANYVISKLYLHCALKKKAEIKYWKWYWLKSTNYFPSANFHNKHHMTMSCLDRFAVWFEANWTKNVDLVRVFELFKQCHDSVLGEIDINLLVHGCMAPETNDLLPGI